MAKFYLYLLLCLLPLQALAAFSSQTYAQQQTIQASHHIGTHCHADSAQQPASAGDCESPRHSGAGCEHCHTCQLCAAPLLPQLYAQPQLAPSAPVLALPPALNFSSLAQAPLYHPPR